jgi:hypothetical protein
MANGPGVKRGGLALNFDKGSAALGADCDD